MLGGVMGLFDWKKKKKNDDDDDDDDAELPKINRQTAAEMYNKKIQATKEKEYWNTGVCWKCGQTMETDSEFCWECGTKYRIRK